MGHGAGDVREARNVSEHNGNTQRRKPPSLGRAALIT
jgi:hypothetical protein